MDEGQKEVSDQVDKVLPAVDDTPLREDDFLDVLEEMMPISGSWKAIGRGLRIDLGRLEMIRKDNPGDSKECLSEALTCWLKRSYDVKQFGEPTWQAVVKVVARPAAGDNCALALKIAKQHSVLQRPVSTKRTPPILQGGEEAQITTHKKTSNAAIFKYENQAAIKAKFADFQTKVCDWLVKNGVDIELFRLFVKNQFPPGDCIPPAPAGVTEIFGAITHHGLWDYLHYSPLVKIVQKFGASDSQIESWAETYKKDLKSFRLVTKVEDLIDPDPDFATLPPQTKVKVDEANPDVALPEERAKNNLHYYCPVEWKTEFVDHSLQYLAEVWEEFSCHYLGPKSPPTALLDRVCRGCFSVTWLVPSYLIPALTKRAKTDIDFFQQHHIIGVTVGEECVYEELAEETTTIADVPFLDDQDTKVKPASEVPSEKVLVGEDEQLKTETESDHSAAFKGLPPLTYTGPLATEKYHALEKQFTELYLSTDHEQIQQLSKKLVESSISPDIKVFALCWEALTEAARENYEGAEKLLRNAWEKASALECQNGLLLQGRVLKHLAHLEYDQGNDDKAEEYVIQAKQRLYNAAPSNETAFTLYTELLVKMRKLFSKHKLPFPVELYRSIENEYEQLLEHAESMEDYEKPVICNFFTMKASFHLRSDLITDKLPPEEYWPSPDDLRKAEECLNSAPLDKMQSRSNSYIAKHYRTFCDFHIWKQEYHEAMRYLEKARKLYDRMRVKRNNALHRVNQRLKLLERVYGDGEIDEIHKLV